MFAPERCTRCGQVIRCVSGLLGMFFLDLVKRAWIYANCIRFFFVIVRDMPESYTCPHPQTSTTYCARQERHYLYDV